MKDIEIQYQKTKIGDLIIGSYQNSLCLLDFRYRKMREVVDTRLKNGLNARFVESTSNVITATKRQLNEYLSGDRHEFTVPLVLVGSDFQKKVWDALMEVGYGETASYLELAKKINNEKAVRAVANANGANAIGIIIPCHRIIGTNGSLTGYGGGLGVKKRLLQMEQNSQMSLF